MKLRSLSYEQQDIVSNVISDKLRSMNDDSDVPPFYSVANTQNMQNNSCYYSVQQQGSMLLLLAHIYSQNFNNCNFFELLFSKLPLSPQFQKKLDLQNLKLQNIVLYSFLKFYEEASPADSKYRHFWVSQVHDRYTDMFKSSSLYSLRELSENMSNLIVQKMVTFNDPKPSNFEYLPWDERRISELLFPIADNCGGNKFSLVLNFMVLKYRSLKVEFIAADPNCDITLSQYSTACSAGENNF